MKLFLSFLVLVAVFQFGSSYVSSKKDVQELLLSDANAVEDGSDVKMAKPGPLEVILNNASELIFGVCSMKCTADFLVCYESDSSGVKKSNQCFEVKMTNGITPVLDLNRPVAKPKTCGPKIENGIVKLNIINATSDCVVSIKNAIIKPETTIAPPTTTSTLEPNIQTSSGENASTTAASGSFFADYWWIFLILALIFIAIGAGVGVCCYLRCKNNAQKPIPARRRRLQGSKSPIVLQQSTENQKGTNESAVRPDSLYNQSSILSHKSLLNSKKDEPNKEAPPESTDLTSMKPTA
uniref:Uncharacterized protein n=1 Tax=Panagrolaimus sp. PS1159 TaxID=55785 RepID=A0AC35FFP1_9BILA